MLKTYYRGVIKTYSKQQTRVLEPCEDDHPRKRLRLSQEECHAASSRGFTRPEAELELSETEREASCQEAVAEPRERCSSTTAPSSPSAADRVMLSSDAPQSESELSSLPSSPPRPPAPILEFRKPTFSFLKRRVAGSESDFGVRPLRDISANAAKKPNRGRKALKQMRIDLGGDTRKKCRSCGMEYVPSVREDADLHKDYCDMNLGGIDVGKTLAKDETVQKVRFEGDASNEGEAILIIKKKSSLAARTKAQKVLAVVNAELGSDDMGHDQLWTETALDLNESRAESRRKGFYREEKKYDEFQAFLHVIDGKCVCFCLVQKITTAFPVVAAGETRELEHKSQHLVDSSAILYSQSPQMVLMGISRIWTSKTRRGKGLAFQMLECTRNNFFYGIQIPRHLIAFSQPTDSGAKLARRWFETEVGWCVYHTNRNKLRK